MWSVRLKKNYQKTKKKIKFKIKMKIISISKGKICYKIKWKTKKHIVISIYKFVINCNLLYKKSKKSKICHNSSKICFQKNQHK